MESLDKPGKFYKGLGIQGGESLSLNDIGGQDTRQDPAIDKSVKSDKKGEIEPQIGYVENVGWNEAGS